MAKLAPRRPQLRPNVIAFSLEFQVPPTLFEQPLHTATSKTPDAALRSDTITVEVPENIEQAIKSMKG